MMFNEADYVRISEIVFDVGYPGYKPDVIESPNGDGNWDKDKRYAHVNGDYLRQWCDESFLVPDGRDELEEYLLIAHQEAMKVALTLGVPSKFWPNRHNGTLRILEYKPGAFSHPHKDFDLFTLMCYRNIPENFKYDHDKSTTKGGSFSYRTELASQHISKDIHFGELLQIIMPDTYTATQHLVDADVIGRTQYSIVYFAIPNHDAVLPTHIDGAWARNNMTVGDWLKERKDRSRKTVDNG